MVTIAAGFAGGFLATVIMTVLIAVLGDDEPSPVEVLWARYVGGDPADGVVPAVALHLVYGTAAGGVFVLLAGEVPIPVDSVGSGVVWAVIWGMGLLALGVIAWYWGILGRLPDRALFTRLVVYHLTYGIVLGAWIGIGVFETIDPAVA